MRLLMIRVAEAGVATCAAIHDGFLFECGANEVDEVLAVVKSAMDKSAVDLIGATIPIKHKVFCSPEHYQEGRTQARELVRHDHEVGRGGGKGADEDGGGIRGVGAFAHRLYGRKIRHSPLLLYVFKRYISFYRGIRW